MNSDWAFFTLITCVQLNIGTVQHINETTEILNQSWTWKRQDSSCNIYFKQSANFSSFLDILTETDWNTTWWQTKLNWHVDSSCYNHKDWWDHRVHMTERTHRNTTTQTNTFKAAICHIQVSYPGPWTLLVSRSCCCQQAGRGTRTYIFVCSSCWWCKHL